MRFQFAFLILFTVYHFHGQTPTKLAPSLSVFLDCTNGGNCYLDFVRNELNILTFVRDRTDADIHVLLTNQYNANGGAIHSMIFVGRNKFQSQNDTLSFYADPNLTEGDRRNLFVKNLKSGLFPFLIKTKIGQDLEVVFPNIDPSGIDSVAKDPWNYWVFQLGFSGYANGNENYLNWSGSAYISINRETEKSRTTGYFNASLESQSYKDNGTTLTYRFQNYTAELTHSWKVNQHIALGLSNFYLNSIFSNYKYRFSSQPRIEYSVFKYKDFNTKRLILGWEVGPQFQRYMDTTVYLKDEETLLQQNISLISSFTQPWGSINLGLFWSNYFHDFSKNQFSINGAISTRLFKGLNLAVWGNYSFVHDQINIRKGDIPIDQLLVQNKELLSSFNFNLGFGISYRFGSKNNNQVFPCFKGLNYSINF